MSRPDPRAALPPIDLAAQHLQAGRLPEAQGLCEQLLAAQPQHSDAWHLSGMIALRQGNARLAAQHIERSLSLAPTQAQALCNLSAALQQLGQPEAALQRVEQALALAPNLPSALNNRGTLLLDLKRVEEGLQDIDRALRLEPGSALAHNNRGHALMLLNQAGAAALSFRRATLLDPNNSTYARNLGKALLKQGDCERAVRCFLRAYQLSPQDHSLAIDIGYGLNELGRHDDALSCFDSLLSKDSANPEAWHGRGLVLIAHRRWVEALSCLEHASQLRPAYAATWFYRAFILCELDRPDGARAGFLETLRLDPTYELALGYLRHVRRQVADWTDDARSAAELEHAVAEGKCADRPLTFLAVSHIARLQRRLAGLYSRYENSTSVHPSTPPAIASHQKIRLGYLSGDFRDHAVAFLMAGVFEQHDRERFEIYGLSLRPPDPSPYGVRIGAAVDQFVDLSGLGDAEAAERIRSLEIDILIDLAGYTEDARPSLHAHRAAPLQVSYLGYPGTFGSNDVDYLIADAYLIPEQQRPHYSEQIVYLPECFQANDDRRARLPTPSRAECGLPEDALVLCCFNNTYKIGPSFFDIWMRLLRAVPRSVLWLVAANDLTVHNLRREATARHVDPERLHFARTLPYPQHLARLGCADLFLDTLPFNGGTTVSDALWSALPVLTVSGEAFAARMAGSLLQAIGLPELIARDLCDYEQLALQLLLDPERLRALRTRLAVQAQRSPLFDTTRFTRHLEAAFRLMLERQRLALPPTHLSVEPLALERPSEPSL